MRTLTLTALLLPLSFVTAADADAVKTRLDKARTVYASEMASYRKRGHQWLDDREDAARARGNKKLVDQVKADRKHFERTDELPKGAPRDLTDRAAFARAKITRAYRTAIADSTRASRDKDAAKLESERPWGILGFSPTVKAKRWVYHKGEYRQRDDKVWVERQTDAGPWYYLETNRTDDYIEIESVGPEGKIIVRLTKTTADYQIGSDPEFRTHYQGKWEE